MKFALKESHFFAAAFFGIAVCWFGALQAVRAASGAAAWSDVPALMMLAVLVNGLLAIGFNFVWLQRLEKRGESPEEPEDYSPTTRIIKNIILVSVLASIFGAVQSYAILEHMASEPPLSSVPR